MFFIVYFHKPLTIGGRLRITSSIDLCSTSKNMWVFCSSWYFSLAFFRFFSRVSNLSSSFGSKTFGSLLVNMLPILTLVSWKGKGMCHKCKFSQVHYKMRTFKNDWIFFLYRLSRKATRHFKMHIGLIFIYVSSCLNINFTIYIHLWLLFKGFMSRTLTKFIHYHVLYTEGL